MKPADLAFGDGVQLYAEKQQSLVDHRHLRLATRQAVEFVRQDRSTSPRSTDASSAFMPGRSAMTAPLIASSA